MYLYHVGPCVDANEGRWSRTQINIFLDFRCMRTHTHWHLLYCCWNEREASNKLQQHQRQCHRQSTSSTTNTSNNKNSKTTQKINNEINRNRSHNHYQRHIWIRDLLSAEPVRTWLAHGKFTAYWVDIFSWPGGFAGAGTVGVFCTLEFAMMRVEVGDLVGFYSQLAPILRCWWWLMTQNGHLDYPQISRFPMVSLCFTQRSQHHRVACTPMCNNFGAIHGPSDIKRQIRVAGFVRQFGLRKPCVTGTVLAKDEGLEGGWGYP